MGKKGFFISLEGIDGCGKSSLKEAIISCLGEYRVVSVREPGGTWISEKIRDLLLDEGNSYITARTEAMLYAAARSQLVDEIIKPALIKGKMILADRYIDSTVAYQGYGRGLNIEWIEQLNQICTGGLKPDLTLLLDLDPEEAGERKKKDIPDRLEKEGILFQKKVREGYLKIAEKEPRRVKVLDAGKEPEALLSEALQYIWELKDFQI